MLGGAITWTDADRLAAAGCGIILYAAGLWFVLRWMATRHHAPDVERASAGDDQGGEQHHGEGIK